MFYAEYISAIQHKQAVKASFVSVVTFLLSGIGTINIVENFYRIIPICLGAWLGTYYTVRYNEIAKRWLNKIIKKIRNEK